MSETLCHQPTGLTFGKVFFFPWDPFFPKTTKLCLPWQRSSKSTSKICLWKCHKHHCDLRKDFLLECQVSAPWRRDLTMRNSQLPSLVPSNAQISLSRDLTQSLCPAPFQISHTLPPPLPSLTSCKSIHSFGQLSHASGFSVPLTGRNWGEAGTAAKLFTPHWQDHAHVLHTALATEAPKSASTLSPAITWASPSTYPLVVWLPSFELFNILSKEYISMLSLKEFSKLHIFSCGYFSSVLPFKGQVCYSGSIFIYIKEWLWESSEREAAELVPISFCPQLTGLILLTKSHEMKQLCSLLN